MIESKYITKIISCITVLLVCICLVSIAFSEKITKIYGQDGITMEYESKLFDTDEVIDIEISIDEDDLKDMLENATAEEYHQCDITINGEKLYNVAIRTKGNTSLTTIASDPTTDRYSFKIEFDHYVDGQTCFGLDKLILNNNYADATSMKEALIYDMYRYLDVDASLYNYAKISINGEYWGVYLALEAVEDSFMLRNYGTEDGDLYKPDSLNFGDMSFDDMSFDMSNTSSMDMPFNMMSFSGSGGADLNYSDDDLDSYSDIWDGEVTKTNESDHKRVVSALKNIANGTDLEEYMDVDNILKYMAVHVFSVNEDSLSGMMAHNYYLYEYDGMLNIIPWDYNLALGGMGSANDATSVVNSAIDEAFEGTEFFDTLMENEEYRQRYYEYLDILAKEYIDGGGFDEFYTRTRENIDELIKTDPTAFYTYQEYDTACDTLYDVVKLRGESIQGQIDGSIPSTSSAQIGSDTLIDASYLDLSIMGSMNTGDSLWQVNDFDTANTNQEDVNDEDSQFDFGDLDQMPDFSEMDDMPNIDSGQNMSPPSDLKGSMPSFSDQSNSSSSNIANIVLYCALALVLIIALVFVKFYKRRPRCR